VQNGNLAQNSDIPAKVARHAAKHSHCLNVLFILGAAVPYLDCECPDFGGYETARTKYLSTFLQPS